ncbi:hypothetical protein FPV67DRAFT_1668683 [Lyophyllum atratum]|nr:hypothetical protein FPV67DRAFT_1668683 [Lyophyllum atratum]
MTSDEQRAFALKAEQTSKLKIILTEFSKKHGKSQRSKSKVIQELHDAAKTDAERVLGAEWDGVIFDEAALEKSRKEAEKKMKRMEAEAEKARQKEKKEAEKAQSKAEKARLKAEQDAEKARLKAEKEAEKVEKVAEKARLKAQKEAEKEAVNQVKKSGKGKGKAGAAKKGRKAKAAARSDSDTSSNSLDVVPDVQAKVIAPSTPDMAPMVRPRPRPVQKVVTTASASPAVTSADALFTALSLAQPKSHKNVNSSLPFGNDLSTPETDSDLSIANQPLAPLNFGILATGGQAAAAFEKSDTALTTYAPPTAIVSVLLDSSAGTGSTERPTAEPSTPPRKLQRKPATQLKSSPLKKSRHTAKPPRRFSMLKTVSTDAANKTPASIFPSTLLPFHSPLVPGTPPRTPPHNKAVTPHTPHTMLSRSPTAILGSPKRINFRAKKTLSRLQELSTPLLSTPSGKAITVQGLAEDRVVKGIMLKGPIPAPNMTANAGSAVASSAEYAVALKLEADEQHDGVRVLQRSRRVAT